MSKPSKGQQTAALTQGWRPYVLSGLLLGLSYPSYPYVRLEVFAWVWMAPMLLALKPITSFPRFCRNVYLTMLLVFICGMSWLLMAHVVGSVVLFFIGSFVFTVPFIFFYIIRRALSWRIALWSAPAVWTAWDWLYQQTEGSFGWISIGLSQSNLYWMVQYVDITGVWGITFWLTLFNVLIIRAIESWQDLKQRPILTRSARRAFMARAALPLGLMILAPLVYSAHAFIKAKDSTRAEKQLSVLLVQPNIDPWQKEDNRVASVEKCVALTGRALARARPDLIIWPETAIPYSLAHDQKLKQQLDPIISRWGVPLLTGMLDQRAYAEGEELPPLLRYEQRRVEVFNSAALLKPQPGLREVTVASNVYHKQVLMPFFERVPFADRWPSLARLAFNFGAAQNLGRGDAATNFSFDNREGETVKVAAPICYEQLYPAEMAEFVRNGAEMFALLTNEGWWSKTHGQYQLAAFSRLRSIETRRAIARCANTGMTCLIDRFGRIYEQAPWWAEHTLSGMVGLSDTMTLYVLYTDYLPKACLFVSLSALTAAFALTLLRVLRRVVARRSRTMIDGKNEQTIIRMKGEVG